MIPLLSRLYSKKGQSPLHPFWKYLMANKGMIGICIFWFSSCQKKKENRLKWYFHALSISFEHQDQCSVLNFISLKWWVSMSYEKNESHGLTMVGLKLLKTQVMRYPVWKKSKLFLLDQCRWFDWWLNSIKAMSKAFYLYIFTRLYG